VIRDDILREVSLGRILGPFPTSLFPDLRISPIGAVPKKDGGHRRIHNLSHPSRFDGSVNAGIAYTETHFDSIDEAIHVMRTVGKGCWFVKVDLEAAYRHLKVHPADWPLLGMLFDGLVFIDAFLPFGASSAPAIFNDFADALAWACRRRLPSDSHVLHYLDDFLFVTTSRERAQQALDTFRLLCSELGVRIKESKTVGPSQQVPFLGLVLDSVTMQLRVGPEKLQAAITSLDSWCTRDSASRRELDSLLGSLTFISRAVRLSRSFLRRMIECRYAATKRPCVPLSDGFRDDARWWLRFASEWNGVELVGPRRAVRADLQLELFTDASGSMIAGLFGRQWFQVPLPDIGGQVSKKDSIGIKELYAVVTAAFTWGHLLRELHVSFRVDNSAAVAAICSRTSRNPHMMALVRHLLFAACIHHFSFDAVHIPGAQNSRADALSRNLLSRFFSLFPDADRSPCAAKLPPSHSW